MVPARRLRTRNVAAWIFSWIVRLLLLAPAESWILPSASPSLVPAAWTDSSAAAARRRTRCCSFVRSATAVSPLQSSSNGNNDNSSSTAGDDVTTSSRISFDDLMEMDVVVFSTLAGGDKDSSPRRQLGAVQEDGRIAPLCVWTTEPAFDSSLEFLVDEEDLLPGFTADDDNVRIHSIVSQELLSFGSRQVGGGMGPGNPHGEESERLYYIDRSVIDGDDNIEVVVKPELEIFW